MDNIIEPNEDFPFSKLSLTIPTGIQGGAYFTKFQFNNKPLYIQTTKSLTRQGIVKSGKKYYCDLMFDKNSEALIQWFENLEETCQKLIYSKSDSWFQTTLDMNDIETAFNSPIRIYKSGKYYLVRVNIKNNPITGDPNIKIYDENEMSLGIQDIQPETNIISILEIQGIKFTNRNFQIDIELKQMMVLNEPIFENCLIKKNTSENANATVNANVANTRQNTNTNTTTSIYQKEKEKEKERESILDELETFDPSTLIIENEALEEKEISDEKPLEENVFIETSEIENNKNNLFEEIQISLSEMEDNKDDLKEFSIQLETNSDPITLKKPNEVYYELYKQARTRAKECKKKSLIAYLEAKNIKKTYMLENLNDSDDDFEEEMEEFGENEIEDLEF